MMRLITSNTQSSKVLRLCVIVAFIAMLLCTIFFPDTTAYAETSGTANFEKTAVLDDLQSDENFDIRNYPFVDTGDNRVQLINVIEYCYTFRANYRNNYGLYLYVYNPNALNIDTSSKGNTVQMAVSYNTNGLPNDYESFDLKFCSMSTKGDYYGLFYKFKVIDHVSSDGKTIAERVNSNERRYDISGIELVTKGSLTARDSIVAGTYRFTGYAAGCGPDMESTESTLSSVRENLDTVELDVNHTFYRTKTSSKGAGYQNQIDSVFFTVPNRYFDDYGELQRIKAEWYEYKTKDIIVTNYEELYKDVSEYLGVPLPPAHVNGTYVEPSLKWEILENFYPNIDGSYNLDWAWNSYAPAGKNIQTLYYLFYTDVEEITEYDPYADLTESGGIPSNVLYDYIMNYNKSHVNGYLPIKGGIISADLFEDDIDDYRKVDNIAGKIQKGYSYYDFDASLDIKELLSWDGTDPTFWDTWNEFGLLDALFGDIPKEENITVNPIEIVSYTDLIGDDEKVCEKYLINITDLDLLRQRAYDAARTGDKVVLFRFATTDYYSASVNYGYRCWESVFLDFDIIQLTFNKDEVLTVIPVVSDPIDIVNGLTTPSVITDEDAWWKLLIGIVAIILLIVIIIYFFPYVVQILLWLIKIPIKIASKLIKAIKKAFKKRE